MGHRNRKIGLCRLCGIYGPLSREHVPPRAAFNDKPVWTARVAELFGAKDFDSFISARSEQDQRGAGGYTLCKKCNNDTGAWYAPFFISWAHQGMEYLIKAHGAPAVSVPFHILPLRVCFLAHAKKDCIIKNQILFASLKTKGAVNSQINFDYMDITTTLQSRLPRGKPAGRV
jgi:hypothetical protein